MSKSNVRVTSNEKGEVIVVSENNPAYAYVRVEQERVIVDDTTGFLKVKNLSALVAGTVKDLERVGWKAGQILPGKIVVRESMKPFNPKNPDASLKVAGDSGVICSKNGEDIHRQTFYSQNENAADVTIAHDNSEQIKAASGNVVAQAQKEDDFKL